MSAGRFQGTGSNPQGCGFNQSINHGQSLDYTVNLDGELARTRDFLGAVNAVMNAGKSLGQQGYDPYAWLLAVSWRGAGWPSRHAAEKAVQRLSAACSMVRGQTPSIG